MRGRIIYRIFTGLVFLVSSRIYAGTDPDLEFRENKGQWAPEILYRAELTNGYLFVTAKGLNYIFFQHDSFKNFPDDSDPGLLNRARNQPELNSKNGNIPLKIHSFSLEFSSNKERPEIVPGKKKEPYYNYFTGDDPSKWASHVTAYGEITYRDLYPGISFRLYSSNGFVKYDIMVDRGADFSQFKYRYKGIESIKKEYNSLFITTSLGKLIENPPYAFQLQGKDTINIPCRFNLEGNEVNFSLPDGYDRRKPLVIDPLLVFSTYSGSVMDNWGNTATYDEKGNVYSGGTVWNAYKGQLPFTEGHHPKIGRFRREGPITNSGMGIC